MKDFIACYKNETINVQAITSHDAQKKAAIKLGVLPTRQGTIRIMEVRPSGIQRIKTNHFNDRHFR